MSGRNLTRELFKAVEEGSIDEITTLSEEKNFEFNASNNYETDEYETAFQRACYIGYSNDNRDVMDKLIELGADINCVDWVGNTPLHNAADFPNVASIEYLIHKGAKINAKNDAGLTPLSQAIEMHFNGGRNSDYYYAAKKLIELGACSGPDAELPFADFLEMAIEEEDVHNAFEMINELREKGELELKASTIRSMYESLRNACKRLVNEALVLLAGRALRVEHPAEALEKLKLNIKAISNSMREMQLKGDVVANQEKPFTRAALLTGDAFPPSCELDCDYSPSP